MPWRAHMNEHIWLVLAGVVTVSRYGYKIWVLRFFAKQSRKVRRDLIAYKHGRKDN